MDVTSTLSLGNSLELTRKATADMLRSYGHSFSLPQPFYCNQRLFKIDTQETFHKEWLVAGMTCETPVKDNFPTLQIGENPALVIRDAESQVHVFHNVCRHRDSCLCVSEKGKVAKSVCPYHQWTYKLDSRLPLAGTEMGVSFDMKEYGPKPVQVKTVGGYILISLAESLPIIDDFLTMFEHHMKLYDMENAKVAVQTTIRKAANWKLVIENNRECYHCNGSHPELSKTLLEWDDVTDPRASQAFKDQVAVCISAWDAEKIPYAHASFGLRNHTVRMSLLDGTVSMTMDGKQGSRKLMGRIKNPDLGLMRILHLLHSRNHRMGDHLVVFAVWPISAQEALVTTRWLMHKDAMEGVDYDVARLREVRDVTNDQDHRLAEKNQRGINSDAYQPDPCSKTHEFGVINFPDWYSERMLNSLGEKPVHVCKVTGS